jgi:hypothetical protein
MHLPDPVSVLHQLLRHLKPGGIIAFQESDFTYPPTAFPAAPVHQQVRQWTIVPPSGGPDEHIGGNCIRLILRVSY